MYQKENKDTKKERIKIKMENKNINATIDIKLIDMKILKRKDMNDNEKKKRND